MYAPIILFVYNRLEHTQKTIDALKSNILAAESELYIYSDAPKTSENKEQVENVRKFIRQIQGFKSIRIIERNSNMGLSNSIISGVSEVINQHNKVIVLEDDLVTSRYFLKYMNDALCLYEDEIQVSSVHGYTFPVNENLPKTFFIKDPGCWGWATWQRAWKEFETNGSVLLSKVIKEKKEKEFNFDQSYDYLNMLKRQIEGKNSSWAIRWYASCFLNNRLTLYPGISLVQNIGNDSSGTHSGKTNFFDRDLATSPVNVTKIPIEENLNARKAFRIFYKRINVPFHQRIINKLKKIVTV